MELDTPNAVVSGWRTVAFAERAKHSLAGEGRGSSVPEWVTRPSCGKVAQVDRRAWHLPASIDHSDLTRWRVTFAWLNRHPQPIPGETHPRR